MGLNKSVMQLMEDGGGDLSLYFYPRDEMIKELPEISYDLMKG